MKTFKKFIFGVLFGLLCGVLCGLCGTIFSKSVEFVTDFRTQYKWVLYLLPLGGIISVGIYKLCHIKSVGTTNVFDSVRSEQKLPPLLSVAVFCGTCISHLFGASSGREGAALQIGGSIADTLARVFKLDEDSRHTIVMCGMASLFSAVFGTPLAACVFVLEIILTRICFFAAIPVLFASVSSFIVSRLLNAHPERFNMGSIPVFSLSLLWKTTFITAICVIIAFLFCKGLNISKVYAKKIFKNEFIRIAIGGIIVVGLTVWVGNYDYNGGGINVIETVFSGNVNYEAFALKMLFTIICVASGYKGGEIIPTLFIGATLGGSLATILGLPIGVGAAVGMAVLFVCATKCPFATILLCGEMFGFSCVPIIIPVVIISFVAARYRGLYNNMDIIDLSAKKLQKNN